MAVTPAVALGRNLQDEAAEGVVSQLGLQITVSMAMRWKSSSLFRNSRRGRFGIEPGPPTKPGSVGICPGSGGE
jgi:hypothetical protein